MATYRFTIVVPPDAGKALKAVKIEQRENFRDIVEFQEEKSRAFVGEQALSLSAIGGSSESGTITVVFEQPIAPGSTVTIAVKPQRNPFGSGVYLFGVTAYPEGDNGRGLYLGSGRIHISD